MDKFGQDMFTIKGCNLKLPRKETCRTIYKTAPLLKLSETSNYTYEAVPCVNEKYLSHIESLLEIKKIIWNNFFQYGESYMFEEQHHYPAPFKVYLEYKLGLNIENDIDTFIVQVRNSIFDFVIYSGSPRLISGANWISDGVLKMCDTYGYIINDKWGDWAKLKYKEK